MVPRRFEDNSTGGASGETVILRVSVAGSVDLGVVVTVDSKMGVQEVLETTCRACVVTTGVSPAFCLFRALIGVSMIYSCLKLCVSHRRRQLMHSEMYKSVGLIQIAWAAK
ncbi:UNVERIFIED_CONTAM: hypothetical protein Slati_0469100 [Sesamum latifolium]|uniref:Uncharacterized protein n=1 Tax=Sesamum latifolium TaxID=2727402 RepID=A0AAW2XWD7_9LAMI